MTDTDKFIHSGAGHILCNDDGTGYTKDLPEPGFAVLITDLGKIALCILESACHDWEDEETGEGL